MELLIAILALAALGPLAARFGYDSRDGYRSPEQQLASYAVTWDERAHQEQLAAQVEAARSTAASAAAGARPAERGADAPALGRRLRLFAGSATR